MKAGRVPDNQVARGRTPSPCVHARRGRFTARVMLFVFLAGYLSLAQPGICSCWLLQDVRHVHPHPAGHADQPHSHDYLFEMFASAPALVPVLPLERPSVLLDLTSMRGVWRNHSEANPGEETPGPSPPTPPPEPRPA